MGGNDTQERMDFLRAASPFSDLDPIRLQHLSQKLGQMSLSPGTVIVTEGERGDACYLVRSGSVEVIQRHGSGERTIATLGAGSLFGEAALLTDSPRNATVRAVATTDLLVLNRSDLLEAIATHAGLGRRLFEILSLRDRPRRLADVLTEQQNMEDGVTMTVLKDPKRGVYYRLSPEGWFLWQRLDGEHNLKDLTLSYFENYKTFSPQAIAECIAGLVAAGFVKSRAGPTLRIADLSRRPWWSRWIGYAARILTTRIVLRNVDRPLTLLYEKGAWLFKKPAQIILGGMALAGLMAFIVEWEWVGFSSYPPGSQFLFALVPFLLLSIVLHEAGHAFAVKACGREVAGIGIGWYWISPIFFVDTSDMWLAGRRQRIYVSLSGAYVHLLMGGVCVLIGWVIQDPGITSILRLLALSSYVMALINLNPLMEYDGYFVLADLLNRPNLRSQSLSWFRRGFLRTLKNPVELGRHRLDLAYGLVSLLYLILAASLAVILYRGYFFRQAVY